jgi:nicotinamide-nucleotide amidase
VTFVAACVSDDDLGERARALIDALRARGWHCATAESCTGGGVAAAITDIAGSSDVFECGYVTYSNAAKSRMLGVVGALIERHGAVSEAVARAMAEGACAASGAQCAVAVTGVAGPGGGTAAKPVGMVCFAHASEGAPTVASTRHFAGDRAAVRRAAVAFALEGLAGRVVLR